MENLFRLLIRYHVFLVFLALQGISFTLLYNTSYYQQSKLLSRIEIVKGQIYSWTSEWTSYLFLKEENARLAYENEQLNNELEKFLSIDTLNTTKLVRDTLDTIRYAYISAKVVNNTTNRQNNFIIIDVGENHGIKPEMAVFSADGVVGVVNRVSDRFATVMSVLNTDFRISAKLKRTGFFGPLLWNGESRLYAEMIEVPQHASVEVGDTVITSGYSAIFPEGLTIGTVTSFEVKKGNFYEIKVKLSTDFGRLHYVNIVQSMHYNEINELQDDKKTKVNSK